MLNPIVLSLSSVFLFVLLFCILHDLGMVVWGVGITAML